ncbi:hypothetical protein RG47T_2430 [Mucilaginibacter polytrichastri]|uniref:Uncharacterized protein n=1 Tax=Mucilaginibacter polytrichastri TaxID=1302689 RepID=A0A1Q5ZZ02_9SPHI|nr:hypothetical protein RG47T_2430 [Mucilaginibacter polytrichastri]
MLNPCIPTPVLSVSGFSGIISAFNRNGKSTPCKYGGNVVILIITTF